MIEILIIILFLTLTATVYIQNRKQNPKKIFNVYAQPGRWFCLKYFSFLALLWTRSIARTIKKISPRQLEQLKSLSSDEKAFDATFFQAVSRDGIYFCGGIERRHNAKANALFYLVIPEYGLLESNELPKTFLNVDPASLVFLKEYSAGGICFKPIEPMKKWRVSFQGKMKFMYHRKIMKHFRTHLPSDKLYDVKLEGEWTSNIPYFMFDTDMSLKVLARAIAREEWNGERFKALKDAHQSHYEQMGFFEGHLTIDGKDIKLEMDAFRDHSFGHKRDWSLMHRYAFHMFYLEDKTRISVGVVSQPCTTSHLEMGYVVLPNKSIYPVENCDFLLYQHGENGNPGTDYAFSLTANGETYETKIKIIHESIHYKGNDIEARLIERFFECEVNGVKGRGISEWHYNNIENTKLEKE